MVGGKPVSPEYEQLAFSVQFAGGKLISATQWKGSIAPGIAIGGSRQRVADLKIPIERESSKREIGYIDRDPGVIQLQIVGGSVIRFVYAPKSGL